MFIDDARAVLTQPVPIVAIPEPVYVYRGLTPGAKLVYGRLYASQTGGVSDLPLERIRRRCGLGPVDAARYLRELTRRGFIERDAGGGFTLLNHPVFEADL